MFLSIVGFIVFFSAAVTSQQTCDAPPQNIRSMKPSFGGIEGFYDIAKGISDGLQSTPNSKTYNDLNNLIFGNGAVTYDQVIKDMVLNQIGAIIFWSFGFVLILAALVLGIATCIWACCYTCVPKEGSIRSKITGYVYASFLVVFFSFVLTGVVLFNITETKLVYSITNALDYTGEITTDLSATILNGTGQLTCEVGKTTQETFTNANLLIQNYSTVVVDGTSDQVGLTAVNNFDVEGFQTQNDASIAAANTLLVKITGFGNVNQECTTNIQTLRTQIPDVIVRLRGFSLAAVSVKSSPELVNINTGILEIKTQVQSQATAASTAMTSAQNTINDAMSSITNMLNNVQSEIVNVMNSLERGHKDVMASSQYTMIQITLRLAVTVPACLGCFFMILAFIAIVTSLINPDGIAQKMAPGVLSTFYTSITCSITLLVFASITFVGGWVMSAMCVPIFEDPSYQLYHLMNQTIAPVGNGTPTVVNIGDLLESCSDPSTTLYTAVNGTNIISAGSITSQLSLDTFRDAANTQINSQPDYSYPAPTQSEQDLNNLKDKLTEAQAASLTSCGDNAANDDYNSYINNLQQSTNMATTFYNNLVTLNQQVPNVKTYAVQQNNQQFDLGDAAVNQSVSNLMTNLSTNIFKCNPFVEIYHNGGFVMCEQFGKPIQGLWAAIGLSGLFMFFLAILLLLIFRWLKKEDVDSKPRHPEQNSAEKQSGSKSNSNRKKQEKKPSAEDDVFYKPVINSTSNTGRLPRIRPYEMDDQLATPLYFSDTSSQLAYPRVQVLPDVRHPPMSPNYYDTQNSVARLARFDDVDLFGDHYSNNGSTARGLRRM